MSVKKVIKETVKNSVQETLKENEGYQTYNPSIEDGEPNYEAIKKACVDGTPNVKQSVEAALNDDKENFEYSTLNLGPYRNEEIKDSEPLENLLIMCSLSSDDLDNERVDTIVDGLFQVIKNYSDDINEIIKNVDNEDEENENIRQVEKEKEEMYENDSKNVNEHHKDTRADKEEFIRQNFEKVFNKKLNPTDGSEEKDLSDMSDETIDWLYGEIENELGLEEQPDSTNVAPLDSLNQPEGTNQSMKENENESDNALDEKKDLIDNFTQYYENEDMTADNLIENLKETEAQLEDKGMTSPLMIRFGNDKTLYTIKEIESILKAPSHQNFDHLMDTIKIDVIDNDDLKIENDIEGADGDLVDEGHDENTWGNDQRTWGNDENMYEMYHNSYEDKKEKTQADRLYGNNTSGYKKQKTNKMEQKKLTKICDELFEINDQNNELVKDSKNVAKDIFCEDASQKIEELEQKIKNVPKNKIKKNIFEKINDLIATNAEKNILSEDVKDIAEDTFYENASQKIEELRQEILNEKASNEETNDASGYNMANVPAQRYLNQVKDHNKKYEEEYMDERLSHIEDSQKTEQDEAYEEKKRQLEDEDEEYIETTRGRDTLDFDYDSEPPEEYKDRVKREVETGRSEERTQEELDSEANIGGKDPYGDDGTRSDVGKDKYKNAQKRADIDDNKPMYNKDKQPVQDEEEYEEEKEKKRTDGTALKEYKEKFFNILNYNDNKPNINSKRDNINEDFKNSYKEIKEKFQHNTKLELKEIKDKVQDKNVEIDQNNLIIKLNGKIASKGYNTNHILGQAEALCETYNNELNTNEAVAYVMTNNVLK